MTANPQYPSAPHPRSVARLGFWSALLAAILALLWVILAVAFGSAPWQGIAAYARSFHLLQVLNTLPAFWLAPAMLLFMVAMHFHISPEGRLRTLVALAFTVAYLALVPALYSLQLHTVRLSLQTGELEGLALLALPNFHSAFFALDTLGYAWLSFALLSLAPLFSGGRRQAWIRRLFWVNGLLGVVGILLLPFDLPWLVLAGGGLWGLLFPPAMLLAALHFRQTGR